MFANFSASFAGLLEKAGLAQTRCINCGAAFFPSQAVSESWGLLCPSCQNILLPFRGNSCRRCGLPLGQERKSAAAICSACARRPPPYKSIVFHGLYNGALRDLLLRFKFSGEIHLARLFAAFLQEAVTCLPRPDFLTPVPQFPKQLRKRGYNQANELCKALARICGFRCANLLERVKPGLPQEHLNALERRANLRGAFRAIKDLRGKTIWLVDDVVTTGSTCFEATTSLSGSSAKEVHVVCVARTPLC